MQHPALSGLLSDADTLEAAELTPRTYATIAGKLEKVNYLFKSI